MQGEDLDWFAWSTWKLSCALSVAGTLAGLLLPESTSYLSWLSQRSKWTLPDDLVSPGAAGLTLAFAKDLPVSHNMSIHKPGDELIEVFDRAPQIRHLDLTDLQNVTVGISGRSRVYSSRFSSPSSFLRLPLSSRFGLLWLPAMPSRLIPSGATMSRQAVRMRSPLRSTVSVNAQTRRIRFFVAAIRDNERVFDIKSLTLPLDVDTEVFNDFMYKWARTLTASQFVMPSDVRLGIDQLDEGIRILFLKDNSDGTNSSLSLGGAIIVTTEISLYGDAMEVWKVYEQYPGGVGFDTFPGELAQVFRSLSWGAQVFRSLSWGVLVGKVKRNEAKPTNIAKVGGLLS